MAGAESNWRIAVPGADAALKRTFRFLCDSICSGRQQCLGLLIFPRFNLGMCAAVICILHNKRFRLYLPIFWIGWQNLARERLVWLHFRSMGNKQGWFWKRFCYARWLICKYFGFAFTEETALFHSCSEQQHTEHIWILVKGAALELSQIRRLMRKTDFHQCQRI